jgi:Tol biopolymer transport system component
VPLQRGQTLLHFDLIDKIGEGGMGEVWKARDTTLDREVAIKVLPAAFAGDRERIARLEREAKLLASLNHPNIAAIYGFPEAAAPSAEGERIRFLAMELVRGEDLAQVLARGPMPVAEAIDAAKQIAAALEAAHDAGVIHRDLKPANIKRTPDGRMKVLDFGLAKALEAQGGSGSSALRTATVTSAGSAAGLVVGTASYMSPEQARGQAVDRRADLWAFGCVLYEMLSGVRAFDGATVTDVLAAVITGEPNWEKLPAATPAAVRRLLRRCLEKDPRRRLRDAGDAGLLLDDNPEDARSEALPRGRSARFPLLAAIGLVVAIAGVAVGWWIAHRSGGQVAASSVEFQRVTYARGLMRSARFAPDGRTIVYGAAWGGPPIKLYLARTDSPEAAPIPLPPAELLAISKSGEMAVALGASYYGWMADGTLTRAPLLGGTQREILEHVRAADWSPDGSQLAVVRRVEGFDQLEYPVGTVLDKTTGYFGDVRISPDGERIAYTDHSAWGDNRGGVAVVDRAGKKTLLAPDLWGVQGIAWTPDGREVWYTDFSGNQGTLRAVDLGGRSRAVYSSIAWIELFDIAPDGRVLLGRQHPQREVLALLDGYTEPRPIIIPGGEASQIGGVMPDGRTALVSNHVPKEYEAFVARSDRAGAVRLSAGHAVALSPDGSEAMTADADVQTLFIVPLGMGPTRAIPNPEGIEYVSPITWLPDGKRFVVVGHKGSDPSRAFVCDVESGAAKPFGEPGVMWTIFTGPPVSPDGKYVVLQGADGISKRWPIEGGEAIAIPGARAEDQPSTFTEDGAAIFVAGRSLPIAIERLDLATGDRTPWITVEPTDNAGLRYALAAITPNGKYWALSTAKLLTDLFVVEGLR